MNSVSQDILVGESFLSSCLSDGDCSSLRDVAFGRKAYHFIEGLPISSDKKKQEVAAARLALGVLGLMNLRLVSYKDEYNGSVIHDIQPRVGKSSEASSSGRVKLPFHTDMAFLRFPGERNHPMKAAAPDFLVLCGVINESHTRTKLVEIEEIISNLEENDLDNLLKSDFDISSPKTVVPARTAYSVPIFFEHSTYGKLLRFNGAQFLDSPDEKQKAVVTPLNDKADNSFCTLKKVIEESCKGKEFDIQPGSLLVFNNRMVVHGRGAIANTTNVENKKPDRHFKRVYGQFVETDCFPLDSENPFVQGLN